MIATPRWYAVASYAGLAWNVIGVAAFVAQLTTDPTTLSPLEREFFETTPVWATTAFGLAVLSGTLGCLALVLRKSWAYPMLVLCLGAIVVQLSHSLFLSNGMEVFGAEGLVLPAFTLMIAALLAWVGRWAKAHAWLA